MRDLTGQRFGLLVAIKDDGTRDKFGAVMWLCKCDCGKEVHIRSNHLVRGVKVSCGWNCNITHQVIMSYNKGYIFGVMKVIDIIPFYSKMKVTKKYLCECIYCGKIKHLSETQFKTTNSCICRNTGEFASNWKGGILPIWQALRNSQKYIDWRNDVFKRDSYTCQHCNNTGVLNAHHIIPFSKIIHDNNIKLIEDGLACEPLWDVNNGTTLCKKCHKEIHRTEGMPKFAFCQKSV